MSELIWSLVWLGVRFNLVLGAAILAVLVLRAPARRVFGARVAYALWLIPPLAAAVCFAPLRVEHIVLAADPSALAPAPAGPTSIAIDSSPTALKLLTAIWIGGALLQLAVLAFRQHRFVGALGRLMPRRDLGARVFAAESAAHGPAVIGVLRPVIVTPADFERRFSADEQRIVLAHEHAHMAQGDPLINACAALLQCLNWFNPLVHLGARLLRVDQELACDAAVLARAENARRPYAEAILKTQIATAPVPLGCAWPSPSPASLKERIAMLKRTLPSRAQTLLGGAVITGAAFAACAAAWSAQPTRLVVTTQPAPESQALAIQTHRLVKTPRGALAPVELARIELDGAPTLSDDPNDAASEQAEADNNTELSNDSEHLRIEENPELFSEQEQRDIRARGALTAAQQARLDAFVHQHVDAAMRRANMAWRREVQESVRIAAREAARHAEASHRYENFHMSPELQAEAEALSRAVTLLATQEMQLAREGRDNAALDAAHAEVRQHADRIRELAERERAVRTDDQGDDDSDRDGHRSDQN